MHTIKSITLLIILGLMISESHLEAKPPKRASQKRSATKRENRRPIQRKDRQRKPALGNARSRSHVQRNKKAVRTGRPTKINQTRPRRGTTIDKDRKGRVSPATSESRRWLRPRPQTPSAVRNKTKQKKFERLSNPSVRRTAPRPIQPIVRNNTIRELPDADSNQTRGSRNRAASTQRYPITHHASVSQSCQSHNMDSDRSTSIVIYGMRETKLSGHQLPYVNSSTLSHNAIVNVQEFTPWYPSLLSTTQVNPQQVTPLYSGSTSVFSLTIRTDQRTNFGLDCLARNSNHQARQHFITRIFANPADATARCGYAIAHLNVGNFEIAAKSLRTVCAQNRPFLVHPTTIGMFASAGLTSSIAYTKSHLRDHPLDADATFCLAILHALDGDKFAAHQVLNTPVVREELYAISLSEMFMPTTHDVDNSHQVLIGSRCSQY